VTARGHYLDGRTAARQAVTVQVVGAGIDIVFGDGHTARWPLGEIRQTQGRYAGEPVRLERAGGPEALLVDDPAFAVALADAGGHARRFHDPRRRRRRMLLTVLAAAGVLAAAVALHAWGIPALSGLAARWVPPAWEDRLGSAIVEHLAPPGRRCPGATGQAALDRITERLVRAAGPVPYRFRVVAVDVDVVNALAAPGGHVIVFRGLLERSASPEALAGVLAHEIQHVLYRHATRAILQHASTAIALTAVAGDASGAIGVALDGASVLGAMAYSRAHEAEADRAGMTLLLSAGVDPAGMIGFFDARDGAPPALVRYLSTHPPSAERVRALRALLPPEPRTFVPVLDEEAWAAVKGMCGPRRAYDRRAVSPESR
jgi:Zn-dependent protease with chaperone function